MEWFFTVFFIALGLSMDAFAVSVSDGLCYHGLKKKQGFAIAATFGIFQGVMPILGYYLGKTFSGYLEAADHWIAFALLLIIGAKMLYDAAKEMGQTEQCPVDKTFGVKQLLVQGVATSIDALAVGVSFALMSVNIFTSALTIAVTTFVCSLIGVILGKKCGNKFKGKAEIAGGIILILIGVKILLEHLLGW